LDTHCKEMTTALSNKLCSGNHRTQEEGDQGLPYLEERSGVRSEDSRIQVQLEEDGSGVFRQDWIEKCGLCGLHWKRQGLSPVSS